MNSPSAEASGRWAALLIRLASRSRHRRDSAMSQRYPFVDAYECLWTVAAMVVSLRFACHLRFADLESIKGYCAD